MDACTLTSGQFWTYSGGSLKVFGDQCLDVTNGSTANGSKMQIWACTDGDINQQFSITEDNRIAWTNKGECLDLTNGVSTPGNQVSLLPPVQ
jgi:hypothetical protein